MPWASGKSPLCNSFGVILAHLARLLSWQEVAQRFHDGWDHLYGAIQSVVDWGLEHRDLINVTAIGVDEISIGKGNEFATDVYQTDESCKRLLWKQKPRLKELLQYNP